MLPWSQLKASINKVNVVGMQQHFPCDCLDSLSSIYEDEEAQVEKGLNDNESCGQCESQCESQWRSSNDDISVNWPVYALVSMWFLSK